MGGNGRGRGAPCWVLVVGGTAELWQALDPRLSAAGCVLVLAEDVEAAFVRPRDIRPHLILVDLRLPDPAGTAMVGHLTVTGSRIPVITISERPVPVDLLGAFPVVGHLVMPLDIESLLHQIAAFLDT